MQMKQGFSQYETVSKVVLQGPDKERRPPYNLNGIIEWNFIEWKFYEKSLKTLI
jgi:hypothetical protein